MKTAVSLAPVPTVEGAALCLAEATPVHVLLATKVLAVLMTQMNVQTHPLFAKMKASVSTPLAPTSELALIKCEKCSYFEDFLSD